MDLYNLYGFNIIVIILNTILALVIALALGKFHEVLHALKAKQLGYRVNKISWWKNEVDIAVSEDNPDSKKIARFPYLINVPIGFILSIIGFYGILQIYPLVVFNYDMSLGVLVGGVATLFLHALSVKFEGKDVNNKMSQVQKE